MYQGSCLCGVVTLEIHGGIDSIIHCYCSKCRIKLWHCLCHELFYCYKRVSDKKRGRS
ncbi:MAG: GFA family protein [Marinomonas sp.]|uniref:GFA family protein n=1 Tax=Marinomonas sp. TaxID=1904862 RepID=UPI003F948555